MSVLYFLVPLSLLMAGGSLCACIWAIRSGQYADMDSPAQQLVMDDSDKV